MGEAYHMPTAPVCCGLVEALFLEVVLAKTQGCWLGDKRRVHNRLARHIQKQKAYS